MSRENADELVKQFILKKFKKHDPDNHLNTCPDVQLTDVNAEDGSYGCDTGCEFVEFEAKISCPHVSPAKFNYGTFGELADILEDLEKGLI